MRSLLFDTVNLRPQILRIIYAVIIAGAFLSIAPPRARAQLGDVQNAHDPVIIKSAGTYYIYCTGNGIPIRTSKDLIHWQNAGRVFQRVPQWAAAEVPGFRGQSLWAPDISFHDGKFYLYYSVSTFASDRSCIGLAINETLDPNAPNYQWVDQGKVVESTKQSGWNAIDPNYIADAQGNAYLAWGSFWGGLKMTQLGPATGRPLHISSIALSSTASLSATITIEPSSLLTIAHRGNDNGLRGPAEENAIEGAFIFPHDGKYYLFASIDMCCRGAQSTYKTIVGRADKPTGPYIDQSGNPMTEGGGTLVIASYGDRVAGPGHVSVLHDTRSTTPGTAISRSASSNDQTTTQDSDYLIHHMYDATTPRGTPTLQIRPLLWDAEGWPMIGAALTESSNMPTRPAPADLTGAWTLYENFQTTAALTLNADHTATYNNSPRIWSITSAALNIKNPIDNSTQSFQFGAHSDYLTGRRQDGAPLYAERAPASR